MDCLASDEIELRLQSGIDERLEEHLDECTQCRKRVAGRARQEASTDLAEPTSVTPFEIQVVLSRYHILGELGRGGMGLVLEAHDALLDQRVALKTLRRDSQALRQRLKREAALGRRIAHPNVCRVYEYFEDGERAYLVMQRLTGITLAERLAEGRVTFSEARTWLQELATGIGAIHRAQVIHRDVTPRNCFLSSEHLVLMDLGLASDAMTPPTRMVMGTPGYWAPEQQRGEGARQAADIYSYGAIARKVSHHLPRVLPRRALRAIERCMAPEPSDRYPTIEAAQEALLTHFEPRRPAPIAAAVGFSVAMLALGGLLQTGTSADALATARAPEKRFAKERPRLPQSPPPAAQPLLEPTLPEALPAKTAAPTVVQRPGRPAAQRPRASSPAQAPVVEVEPVGDLGSAPSSPRSVEPEPTRARALPFFD